MKTKQQQGPGLFDASTPTITLTSGAAFKLPPQPPPIYTPPKDGWDIVLPEDPRYVPRPLVEVCSDDKFDGFPRISRTPEGIREIIHEVLELRGHGVEANFGLDLEFDPRKSHLPNQKPSILGLSSRTHCAAVPWDSRLMQEVLDACYRANIKLVGHSIIGADKPEIDRSMGIKTPLLMWRDSMITHFLNHQEFAKTPDKEEDKEEAGTLGLMNLYTAASMVMTIRRWKDCLGSHCSGNACRIHSSLGYCAVDSYAGLEIHERNEITLEKLGVPKQVRLDMLELGEVAWQMEQQGNAIDKKQVAKLRKQMKEHREMIFEHTGDGASREYTLFNPNAPQQVLAWFKSRGVSLEKADKKVIKKTLETTLKRYGYKEISDLEDPIEDLPEVLSALLSLHQYKEAGRGVDSWFGDKYIKRDGLIHPRWITTASSMTRWSSSGPNFANIPSRGWGKLLKTCVIPRDPDCDFVESDASQLELRILLYVAGYDSRLADGVFEKIVEDCNGILDKPAADAKSTPRNMAKSIAHASNFLESITLLTPADLMTSRIKAEIDAGALEVHRDWIYCNKIVAFTGGNLADRILGSRTRENRALALAVRRKYLNLFPNLERLQKQTLEFIEENGFVRIPGGKILRLYDDPKENAKMAMAAIGQGGGAAAMQSTILKFKREANVIPELFIHDSIVLPIPKCWTNKQAYDLISMMYESSYYFADLKIPGKATRGPNYGALEPLIC